MARGLRDLTFASGGRLQAVLIALLTITQQCRRSQYLQATDDTFMSSGLRAREN